MGHSVEIHEAGPMAGGMMHFGIPAYRLPRDVLDGEIKRIERMGVKIVLNHKVEDLRPRRRPASSTPCSSRSAPTSASGIDIPAATRARCSTPSASSRRGNGQRAKLGRRVAIYGGGNTAMDAAHGAKRLGYEPLIIYRRDRAHMPAHDFEADEAIEEGVKIHWLRTIKSIDETTFTVEVMEVDENGRPQPTGAVRNPGGRRADPCPWARTDTVSCAACRASSSRPTGWWPSTTT
jgi:formate dehydrogenase (NADP+) beta subunit